ncbi:MAG TPA: hydroxysqualene dehydroxylase HpnE [Candidatus Dormibacteraeota bacterium]|nr:hydroxysqualene dehydroxylase HpnE [Candidatus Dormibacteraeota bacterium]
MEALVVGGGLAGISATLELADQGARVTLVERAPVLGGLCRSVPDPVAGRVDTGQHVYLGCCTELERFLERIEVEPAWRQRRLELVVANPRTGVTRRLHAAPLPAPAHLLPVLLRWPGLPTRQLVQSAAVATALRSLSADDQALLDAVPARSWLHSLGQDDLVIRQLWDPFLISACNVSLDRCSAGLAAYVIREGLLGRGDAGALRIPATDLTAWLDPPSRRRLAAVGVDLKLRWRAAELLPGRVRRHLVRSADGEEVEADLVVLAGSAMAAKRLLGSRGIADPILEAAALLPNSPIVNLHLFTDRPFLPGPVVTAPGSPLQWLFDRSRLGEEELVLDGQPIFHSAVSLSAAEELIGIAETTVTESLWRLCQDLFPAARRARLRHSRVTREAAATFAAVPGSAAARPGPTTPLEGLWLAGNWTDTGWPATMEGAVRSGRVAADAASGRSTKRNADRP